MLFPMNNPPAWLARALQLVDGGAPPVLQREMVPVVEALQAGWGLARYEQGVINGSTGSAVTQRFTTTEAEMAWISLTAVNVGTAAITVSARVGVNGNVFPNWFSTTVGAGATVGMLALAGGVLWVPIPPNGNLDVTQGTYATTAGNVQYLLARLPAGAPLR